MSRTCLMLAALLVVPACDSGEKVPKPKDGAAANKDDVKPAADADKVAKTEAEAEPTPKKDPFQEVLDARVLSDSGLGVGGKLSAFDIFNSDTGEQYCQVCRFGSSPKVMAVGTVDDEAFREDLKNLDAIVEKYGDDKIKAFAVVTDMDAGKAITPKDPKALQDKAKTLKAELGISIPVVVPAPEEDGPNRIWDEYYNITKSRTVMFADGRNVVKYNGVATEDFSKLNDAIVEVVGS